MCVCVCVCVCVYNSEYKYSPYGIRYSVLLFYTTCATCYACQGDNNRYLDCVMVIHGAYYFLTVKWESSTFQETMNSLDASLWMIAMHEEMEPCIRTRLRNFLNFQKVEKP